MNLQFGENAQEHYFFSQPHQPFFVLGFVNAIVTMLIFMLAYKGVIHLKIDASYFHVYGFTYLLFTPAFFGFLFTTFPRFTATAPIEKKRYMDVFSLYYLGSALFLLGSIVAPFLSYIGMFMILIGHLIGSLILKRIYTSTTMTDKHDIFWILFGMGFGVLANALFIFGMLFSGNIVGLSMEMSTYLYLFLVTFSVAQRMVPFFSHCMVEKNQLLLRWIFILLILHILLEGISTNSSFVVDFAIALLVAKELHRWNLPFPNPNPLIMVLHIALFWVPLAFGLTGLSNMVIFFSDVSFLAMDMHLLPLGFVFTILIGFGTRVTLGHSGNMMKADKYTTLLFYWTQVVVVLRILVSLTAAMRWNFMILFDISATVWIVMFVVWGVRFFPVLINGKKLTPTQWSQNE